MSLGPLQNAIPNLAPSGCTLLSYCSLVLFSFCNAYVIDRKLILGLALPSAVRVSAFFSLYFDVNNTLNNDNR